ncbi:hypothetical protein LTR09_010423 [Extremus antarcticus]|uniref:Ima1 N-terminal domain-containing protein n=1 Tax=Extremus antarcticus TaxID=702011 RepID=A0AAJ0D7R4_9PEZI|nr:hypothetical protein LTR09_010423 [Extremus antarcticus]
MFWRLRCHFCGTRSAHSKGTHEFQCTNCEAFNFYDNHGNVVDTPDSIIAAPPTPQRTSYQTFSRPQSKEAPRQDDSVFCNRCRTNQRIYTEALSNYLPDEDHPQYAEYEAKLPQAKAELEKKYPLICNKCASKAQHKIRQADYYGKTQQTAKMMQDTRRNRGGSPVGRRDDWGKWFMRMLLSLIGMAIYASLLSQIAWHAYGMMAALTTTVASEDYAFEDVVFIPSLLDCAKQTRFLRFDPSCYQLFAALMPRALFASLCLIWYNPGLSSWYHRTWRMEAVGGQTEHFRIQALLLIIRYVAWVNLSNVTTTKGLSKQQLLAAHGFMTVFMLACQWLSERTIHSVRWVLRGKIMPNPDEVDVFGDSAGPAEEQYHRQASSVPPQLRLFARNEKPFPIEKLAPQPKRGYSRLDLPVNPPPSPPFTDDDMMDIDSSNHSANLRSTHNHRTTPSRGWGGMRNELFGIDDQTRAQIERQRAEEEQRTKLRYSPPVAQSPFRGRLPPAPMSMERRLRNPPTQVSFKKAPLSKQQDFMQQMRAGIDDSKGYSRPNAAQAAAAAQGLHSPFSLDDDSDFSPIKVRMLSGLPRSEEDDAETSAKLRTKGSLDLRPGTWTLKSDLDTSTGLEDMFGGRGFSIADDAATQNARIAQQQRASAGGNSKQALVLLGLAGVVVAVCAIEPVRRAVCLWLVGKLEGLGY